MIKIKAQFKETTEELEELKRLMIEERKQIMEKLELFPEPIEEAKQIFYKKVMTSPIPAIHL